jgi:glutamine synthetase
MIDPVPIDIVHSFFAKHKTVRFVRYQWLDLSGILRTRIVTKAHCLQLAESSQFLTVGQTLMLFPVSNLQVAEVPATGCAELRPDWVSLRHCGYAPNHASVMCAFYVRGREDPYSLCPKTELERTINRFEAACDKTIAVGFEIEFVILNHECKGLGGSHLVTTNSTTFGMRTDILDAMEEVVMILDETGIKTQTFHVEGPSQLELAMSPLPPIEAIASMVYSQETIKTVFARHQIVATMTPHALASGAASGAHLHFSISSADNEDAFLAGILDRLCAVSAFGLANYDSFQRVADYSNSTGTWVSWGHQHRDVPIRKVAEAHWELRCMDATANPYIVLSLIIAAGLEGISASKPLRMLGLTTYASSMTPFELQEAGVTHRLPRNMKEALEILNDPSIDDLLVSHDIRHAYVTVKEVDLKALGDMNHDERRTLFAQAF